MEHQTFNWRVQGSCPCSGAKVSYFFFFFRRLPCSSNDKQSACEAEDQRSIPGLGSSSGEGNGNPLQYSCLENSTDSATIHGVIESRTRLSNKHTHSKKSKNHYIIPTLAPPTLRYPPFTFHTYLYANLICIHIHINILKNVSYCANLFLSFFCLYEKKKKTCLAFRVFNTVAFPQQLPKFVF